MPAAQAVFEDDSFLLEPPDSCPVPGYLILRFKEPASSVAELSPGAARRFGAVLSRAVGAIEAITGAERVYCLSFGEIDRRLHFHLFPRTHWLLDAYWRATGTEGAPVNGPMLFEWARAAGALDAQPQAGAQHVRDACTALRARLTEPR